MLHHLELLQITPAQRLDPNRAIQRVNVYRADGSLSRQVRFPGTPDAARAYAARQISRDAR